MSDPFETRRVTDIAPDLEQAINDTLGYAGQPQESVVLDPNTPDGRKAIRMLQQLQELGDE